MHLSRYWKIGLVVLCMLLGAGSTWAQSGQGQQKELKFITAEKRFLGVRFIYDRQIINNPLALQIPMLQLRDPEVSREFLMYKSQRQAVQWLSLISAGVSLYTIFNRDKVSDGFYWGTVGGTLLVNSYLNIKSNIHLGRAVNRFNQQVLLQNQIGLSMETLPTQQTVAGLSWRHSF
ncbi:hypothetical protein [Flectobacillus major]|uniref:hypothetical protein n=1 Tax=Flectobacillus major TaxID=103 RepID=UPI00040C50C9|nr:hypothetical protein [Flectobacillus major]